MLAFHITLKSWMLFLNVEEGKLMAALGFSADRRSAVSFFLGRVPTLREG